MKFAAVLCIALVAAVALAQDAPADNTIAPFTCEGNVFLCKLKEFGHHIKFHANKLGGTLKDVGSNILAAALEQGKNLLTTGSQAVLGTVLEHMNKSGLGKREDVQGLVDRIKGHLKKGAEFLKHLRDSLKAKFEEAVNSLTIKLKDVATLKGIEEDADKKIDAIIAKFKEAGSGGFLKMAVTIGQKIKDVWAEALAEAKAKMSGKKVEKRVILDFFNKAKDTFSALTGKLAETFKPHLDALTEGVKAVGDKLKEHGTNLVNAAKGHFDTLKGKLTGHLDALKGHASTLGTHAQNALNALKDAVTDIVKQTATNVSGTVDGIVKTGIDASGVITDHVSDALSGSN